MRLVCKYSKGFESYLTFGNKYYVSNGAWKDDSRLIYVEIEENRGITVLKSRFIPVSVRLYYEKVC